MKLMRKTFGVSSSSSIGTFLGSPMEIDGRTTTPLNDIQLRIQKKILLGNSFTFR